MEASSQSPQDGASSRRVDDNVLNAPMRDPPIAFNASQLPAVNMQKGHDTTVLTEKEIDGADERDERDVRKGQVYGVLLEVNLDKTNSVAEIPWETPSVARLPIYWCHLR